MPVPVDHRRRARGSQGAGDAVPDGDEWRALAAVTGGARGVDPRAELVGAAVILVVATALTVAGLLALNVGILVAAVVVGTAGAIWWGGARRRHARQGRR
jgi:Flp pilus assembly protein TadB